MKNVINEVHVTHQLYYPNSEMVNVNLTQKSQNKTRRRRYIELCNTRIKSLTQKFPLGSISTQNTKYSVSCAPHRYYTQKCSSESSISGKVVATPPPLLAYVIHRWGNAVLSAKIIAVTRLIVVPMQSRNDFVCLPCFSFAQDDDFASWRSIRNSPIVSRLFLWRKEFPHWRYVVSFAGPEARRLREVPGAGSEEPARERFRQ